MLKTITINTKTHRVVPIEPTVEMIKGALNCATTYGGDIDSIHQEEIRAAISAAPEFNESPWQSIESAPKDKVIFAIKKYATYPILVRFDNQLKVYRSYVDEFIVYDLTHWMPLPPAPEGI